MAYGASLWRSQPSAEGTYCTRSWRRLGRPCQNSHLTGMMRQPPQNGGLVTSLDANRASTSATRFSRTSRLSITSDCGEAHAPIWEPLGRLAKYASLSSSEIRSTLPVTRTCRWSANQPKTPVALLEELSCSLFAELKLVKNVIPLSDTSRARTIRPSGTPNASTVATVIAFGSTSLASAASSCHRCH